MATVRRDVSGAGEEELVFVFLLIHHARRGKEVHSLLCEQGLYTVFGLIPYEFSRVATFLDIQPFFLKVDFVAAAFYKGYSIWVESYCAPLMDYLTFFGGRSSFSQEQTAVYLEGLSINGKRDERDFFFTSTFPFGNWILLPPFSVALTQLSTNYEQSEAIATQELALNEDL